MTNYDILLFACRSTSCPVITIDFVTKVSLRIVTIINLIITCACMHGNYCIVLVNDGATIMCWSMMALHTCTLYTHSDTHVHCIGPILNIQYMLATTCHL